MLLSIRLTIKIYALCHTRSVLLLLVLDRTPFFSCRFIEKYRTPIYISIVRYAAVDTSHYKDICIVSYTVGLAAFSVALNTAFSFLSIYRKYRTPIHASFDIGHWYTPVACSTAPDDENPWPYGSKPFRNSTLDCDRQKDNRPMARTQWGGRFS